eukprot:c12813_g2_i1.p1 GENE.c12813_g2_i1~~c12813_g2_i1.p1  ORF type:complete len:1188 (+),score=403.83 c12813_g2_i1:50-3613(+)
MEHSWFFVVAFVFAQLLACVVSDAEVVGCGGFVSLSTAMMSRLAASGSTQSQIDLSRIKITLFTAQGAKKYDTECAPNGYYFIPIYDETGSFDMVVDVPNGWTATPSRIPIKISSMCNNGDDINFVLTGFTISGSVVSDTSNCETECTRGPSGVTVELQSLESPATTAPISTTTTNGVYAFENMLPGQYRLRAHHPQYTMLVGEVTAQLLPQSREAPSLVMGGFPISGRVLASGDPILGVDVYLLAGEGQHKAANVVIAGCKIPTSLPSSLKSKVLCHTQTQSDGAFSFTSVPCGRYVLHPIHSNPTTVFDVQPATQSVLVNHNAVTLTTPFRVTGFSVSGKVVHANGAGVADVAVSFNGEQRAVTDENGHYRVDSIDSGSFNIQATKEHVFFEALSNHRILPASPLLPDIVVSKYHLCGTITINQVPQALPLLKHRDVVLTGGKTPERRTTNALGQYCFEAAPGVYYVTPTTTPEERAGGLTLQPQTLSVTITNAPKLNANFVQLLVNVRGSVACMGKCDEVHVTLARTSHPAFTHGKAVVDSKGLFSFPNVIPGQYTATVSHPSLCWDKSTIEIEVGEEDKIDVRFSQKGFVLTVDSTHACELKASLRKSALTPHSLQISVGSSSHCLLSSGVWDLEPKSCFRFDQSISAFDTSSAVSTLTLRVKERRVQGRVRVPHSPASAASRAVNVHIGVRVNGSDTEEQVRLTPTDTFGVLQWEYWAPSGSSLEVFPRADGDVLFYPRSLLVTVSSGSDCEADTAPFGGRAGLELQGYVTPAIAAVEIRVASSNETEGEAVAVLTDESGMYTVSKLYDDTDYKITASREGYHLEEIQGEKGNFRATPLSTVHVVVRLEDETPLEGVLVSLSDKGYRSNVPTRANGSHSFSGLFPSQYFMRPFMKEYMFEPSSRTVVCDGSGDQTIEFVATRTAFSIFGKVREVGGAPLSGAVVEAIAKDDSSLREDAQTDKKGNYRLRGLVPGHTYEVVLKTASEATSQGTQSVTVALSNADANNVNFVVFPVLRNFDITIAINTNTTSALGHVHAVLASHAEPTKVLKTSTIGYSGWISFAMLPPGTYVVSFSCDLDAKKYSFPADLTRQVDLQTFHQHLQIDFPVDLKNSDVDDIPSGSFLSFLLFLGAIWAVRNREDVVPVVRRYVRSILRPKKEKDVAASTTTRTTTTAQKPQKKKQ